MITRDEWLSALNEAVQPPEQDPSVLTASEIGALMGFRKPAALRHADRLVRTGRAQRATKVIQISNGQLRVVPAYRLLKKKKS